MTTFVGLFVTFAPLGWAFVRCREVGRASRARVLRERALR